MEANSQQDQAADKGFNSVYHYGLLHTLVPLTNAMKIPPAKATFDTEWDKLKQLASAWDTSKVRDKADVIRETQARKILVHLATSMGFCHLKHSELATHLQQYTGRVVLRGDDVKDDV